MLHFRNPALNAELPPELDVSLAATGMRTLASPEFAASGIAPSAVVETAEGPQLARDLKPGDRLPTRDHGMQSLRWVGASTEIYGEDEGAGDVPQGAGPVRIRAGAFGTSANAGNLVLAPGHRVLLRHPLNGMLFGTDEAMVRVGDLTHLDGVETVQRHAGRWVHMLFDTHEMIRINGLWVESFVPDTWSLQVAYPEQWEAITEAVPRLRFDAGSANYVEARLTLDAREASLIDAG